MPKVMSMWDTQYQETLKRTLRALELKLIYAKTGTIKDTAQARIDQIKSQLANIGNIGDGQ